jgi:hypothetical protein
MQWILVVLAVNSAGHTFIANSSWMDADPPGYPTLETCERHIGEQRALHPNPVGSAAMIWECLAVDFSVSRKFVPSADSAGDWQ